MLIFLRSLLIISALLTFFSPNSGFAGANDGDDNNEWCFYDVCKAPCNWEELKISYATQTRKEDLERREQIALDTGLPFVIGETCLVDEWMCKNGFERTDSCSKVNPDKGMSIDTISFGFGPYSDGPEPVPTEIPASKNTQNEYQNDCQSGVNSEGAELIGIAGMKGVFSYTLQEYEKSGMPCFTRACSYSTFNASGYLRSSMFDLHLGGGQRFASEGCHSCPGPDSGNYSADCIQRFRETHSENPVTSSPEEFKAMLLSYASYMASGSQALLNLAKTGQGPEPGDYGSSEEVAEESTAIHIQADADGFSPFKDTLFTKDFAPSSITLHGMVKDVSGKPISGARVTLSALGVSVQSAPDGSYHIHAETDGSQPFKTRFDLNLQQDIKDVSAKIAADSPIYANGKLRKVWLHISADGKAYKNKPVQILQTSVFKIGDRETDLLTLPQATNETIQTDEYGSATVTLYGPRVQLDRMKPMADSQRFFPVNGFLELRGEWDSMKKVMVPYEVQNPFPVIRKLVVPGNIDEESWQITPTRVYIDDPDSDAGGEWKVTVEAVGSLKILHGPLTKGKISGWTTTSPFEFHYRPPKMGLDLQKQPELAMQLIEVNLKVALAMFIGNFEDRIPEGSNVKKAYNTAKNALSYLDRATDTTNLVTSDQTSDPGAAMIKGFDYVIAMTDTAFGLLGASWCPQVEMAKGAYENAKVFHAALKGYEKISNAYQDTVFMPITVTVEDEMGHKTTKTGKCSVKVWMAL